MNYKLLLNLFGKTFIICALFFFAPVIIALIYGESNYFAYLIPAGGLLLVGGLFQFLRPKSKSISPKEAFVITALSWIVLSLVGALPFVLSGEVTGYIDALFETVSGLTTTGASVLEGKIELLSKSLGFWRVFTHFMGGMGVLVFLLVIMPNENGSAIQLLKAESPGPTATKFASKLRFTARILYLIYIALTLIMAVLLICGGMDVYDAFVHAFSTAGTGGFSTKTDSIAAFNSNYIEIVVSVFMFLFGVNFNVFFLILIGKFSRAFFGEEFLTYLLIVLTAVFVIAIDLLVACGSVNDFGDALRLSLFQSTAISSTTGFTTADINAWPALSQSILLILMVIGGSGGSTAGGIKVSRFIILTKSSASDLKKMMRPRAVVSTKFERETLDSSVINAVRVYFTLWVAILIVATLALSIDPTGSFAEDFTGALTAIGNVGPRLGDPFFNGYGVGSKIVLCFTMLAGRLEIIPLFVLFNPRTWKKS